MISNKTHEKGSWKSEPSIRSGVREICFQTTKAKTIQLWFLNPSTLSFFIAVGGKTTSLSYRSSLCSMHVKLVNTLFSIWNKIQYVPQIKPKIRAEQKR